MLLCTDFTLLRACLVQARVLCRNLQPASLKMIIRLYFMTRAAALILRIMNSMHFYPMRILSFFPNGSAGKYLNVPKEPSTDGLCLSVISRGVCLKSCLHSRYMTFFLGKRNRLLCLKNGVSSSKMPIRTLYMFSTAYFCRTLCVKL